MVFFISNHWTPHRFVVLSCVFIGILLVASSGVAAAMSTPVSTGASTPLVGGTVVLQSGSGAANTTDLPPPHRNPDTIEDSSDLSRLESVLSGSLNGRLSESLASLDADDYERARELLGDEYTADLERYRGIAEETGSTAQTDDYQTAQTSQQEYVESVAQYEETQQEYEQARESGNDQRARELARELVNTGEEVNRTAERVSQTYQRLDQTTAANFTDEVQTIERRQTTVQRTRQDLTEGQLVETSLSVTASQSSISFTDSLQIRGELRTATGGSIESQRIQLVVDEQSYTVDINPDGTFQQRLQPSDVWQSGPIAVEYVPDPQSVYLGATATLPVSIEPTETTVRIDTLSEQASFDTPVQLQGTLETADTGDPVPAAPVSLRLSGEPTETVRTTTAGEFQIEGNVSPRVPAGQITAQIGLEPSQLALTGSQRESSIEITSTETNLTMTAMPASAGRMAVSGELRSVGDRAVSTMPVRVAIDNTTVGTVATDQTGTFNETFVLPETTDASGAVHIDGAFAGEDSNLEAASATTTVNVGVFDTTTVSNPAGLLLLLGVVSIVVAISGWWFWRRSPSEQPDTSGANIADRVGEGTVETSDSTLLLTAADEALHEGSSESAAKLAYAAVRRYIGSEVTASETATHWEWYHACTDAGVDQLSVLRSFIEDFEQVTFAPTTEQTMETVDQMISTARQLISDE